MKNLVVTLAFLGAVVVSSVGGFLLGREPAFDLAPSLGVSSLANVPLADLNLSEDERLIISGYMGAEMHHMSKGGSGSSDPVMLAASDEYSIRCELDRNNPDFCTGFARAISQVEKALDNRRSRKNLTVIKKYLGPIVASSAK